MSQAYITNDERTVEPIYTDYDMEIVKEVLPSSKDLFSIDEITVELLMWCGRTGTNVL